MGAGVVGDIEDLVDVEYGEAQAGFFNLRRAAAKDIVLIAQFEQSLVARLSFHHAFLEANKEYYHYKLGKRYKLLDF